MPTARISTWWPSVHRCSTSLSWRPSNNWPRSAWRITRLARVRADLDAELEEVFAELDWPLVRRSRDTGAHRRRARGHLRRTRRSRHRQRAGGPPGRAGPGRPHARPGLPAQHPGRADQPGTGAVLLRRPRPSRQRAAATRRAHRARAATPRPAQEAARRVRGPPATAGEGRLGVRPPTSVRTPPPPPGLPRTGPARPSADPLPRASRILPGDVLTCAGGSETSDLAPRSTPPCGTPRTCPGLRRLRSGPSTRLTGAARCCCLRRRRRWPIGMP